MDAVVFWSVVGARILLPLAVFRFPLPTMLACLVIDGLDQTIFQTFTSLPLEGYQSYDKALDVYYLSMAYLAMLRNWVSRSWFDVGRFLFYYRLVGVVLFETTQIRAILLVFPNTFEYFFDLYEAIRTRWDPRRMTLGAGIAAAAFIWIFIKLPQEWWIHIAQLDATDLLKTQVFGVSTDASWLEAIAAAPGVIVAVVIAILVAVLVVWRVVVPRLPEADHPFTLDADAHQPMVAGASIDRERQLIAERPVSLELLEKVVLTGLVSLIFSRMLPGAEPSAVDVLIGVGVVVIINTLISSWAVRRGDRPHGAVEQFVLRLIINVVLVLGGQLVIAGLTDQRLEHALVYVLLLSVILTAYDRYRPLYKARFVDGPLPYPGTAATAG